MKRKEIISAMRAGSSAPLVMRLPLVESGIALANADQAEPG